MGRRGRRRTRGVRLESTVEVDKVGKVVGEVAGSVRSIAGGDGWWALGRQRGTGVLPHRSNTSSISCVTFVRRILTFLVGCASNGILTDATPPGAVENKNICIRPLSKLQMTWDGPAYVVMAGGYGEKVTKGKLMGYVCMGKATCLGSIQLKLCRSVVRVR